MRVLGIDYGGRRIGLALSDASGTLASPLRVVERPRSEPETVRLLGQEIARLVADDDGLATVVVGWPRRLDGTPNAQTPLVEALALTERDWRKRKQMLDAAAAAIVLQDYLDEHSRA